MLSLRHMARWVKTAMRLRVVQSGLLGLLVVGMMGAGESRYDRLGHEMICTCGCTQILMECNHVGCPVSPVMLNELKGQLAAGGSDTVVLNWFAAKYGAIVLAAPIRGGFDDVAWIIPIAAFGLATVGTGVIVWAWRRRTLRLGGPAVGWGISSGAPAPEAEALRERIRRETEYR